MLTRRFSFLDKSINEGLHRMTRNSWTIVHWLVELVEEISIRLIPTISNWRYDMRTAGSGYLRQENEELAFVL